MKASQRQLLITWGWVVFTVPYMVWWRNSIALVGFLSAYAIVISHWTAYVASKADEAAEAIEKPARPPK